MTLITHLSKMGATKPMMKPLEEVELIEEEFDYINLQGTFGDINPCLTTPKETILCINTPNQRHDYCAMIEFITKEARRE